MNKNEINKALAKLKDHETEVLALMRKEYPAFYFVSASYKKYDKKWVFVGSKFRIAIYWDSIKSKYTLELDNFKKKDLFRMTDSNLKNITNHLKSEYKIN